MCFLAALGDAPAAGAAATGARGSGPSPAAFLPVTLLSRPRRRVGGGG